MLYKINLFVVIYLKLIIYMYHIALSIANTDYATIAGA